MKKRLLTIILSLFFLISPQISAQNNSYTATIEIDFNKSTKSISPYIYGANDWVSRTGLTVNAIRQGGNRLSGYNWENNFSNAGEDWYNYSDNYLVSSLSSADQKKPAIIALNMANQAEKEGIDYTVTALQMAGYVAKDGNREVYANESAPSSRWAEVIFKKPTALSTTPNLTDNAVYMDEYINYLIKNLGKSTTSKGINGYTLDNEPDLWNSTHPRIQTTPLKASELIKKSVALSKVVKSIDSKAEVFGYGSYGFNGYMTLQGAPDWNNVKGSYKWFIDYYLAEMKKASDSHGSRLLDVLNLHYYSEAQTPSGVRVTNSISSSDKAGLNARMQAPRTLWDSNYTENSWIGQWFSSNLPLIPTVKSSIDKYYPNTKLSFTEYYFGGANHVSGGIAQVDALGIFAEQGVYLATVWPTDDSINYLKSGINLYTNYDGKGASFGDTLLSTSSNNKVDGSAYSAMNKGNTNSVRVVVLNKNQDKTQKAVINLKNASKSYTGAKVYGFTSSHSAIKLLKTVSGIKNNSLTYEVPPMSAVVIEFNASGESPSTTKQTAKPSQTQATTIKQSETQAPPKQTDTPSQTEQTQAPLQTNPSESTQGNSAQSSEPQSEFTQGGNVQSEFTQSEDPQSESSQREDTQSKNSLENADESNASNKKGSNDFGWIIALLVGLTLCAALGMVLFKAFKK